MPIAVKLEALEKKPHDALYLIWNYECFSGGNIHAMKLPAHDAQQ